MKPNYEYIQDNVPIRASRGDYINYNEANTATSMALILYLQYDVEPYNQLTTPIMKWLNEVRNAMLAWGTTRVGTGSFSKVLALIVLVPLS